jgi:hypothetical protein
MSTRQRTYAMARLAPQQITASAYDPDVVRSIWAAPGARHDVIPTTRMRLPIAAHQRAAVRTPIRSRLAIGRAICYLRLVSAHRPAPSVVPIRAPLVHRRGRSSFGRHATLASGVVKGRRGEGKAEALSLPGAILPPAWASLRSRAAGRALLRLVSRYGAFADRCPKPMPWTGYTGTSPAACLLSTPPQHP